MTVSMKMEIRPESLTVQSKHTFQGIALATTRLEKKGQCYEDNGIASRRHDGQGISKMQGNALSLMNGKCRYI